MASPNSSNIVDRVSHFIARFVFLKRKELYRLLATWVLATYLTDIFEYMGYIFAHSPEKESGKSRLLEVLDVLVHNSSGVLIRPTPAVLFRTAEGMTQLLDEVDSWTNKDELSGILNAGFRRGARVPRMEGDGRQGYKAKYFLVYAPRALAGIGLRVLDDTTRDRTFTIEMVRQTKGETRERFSLRNLKKEIIVIRQEISQSIEAGKAEISKLYEASEFSYLNNFRDRTIDVSQPIAAITEFIYHDGPALEQARLALVEAIAVTRQEKYSPSDDWLILRELLRLTESEDPLVGTASELAARCIQLPENPNEFTISAALRKYNFEVKSIRKDGMPKYRYSLSRPVIQELVQRYSRGSATKENQEAPVVTVVE